MRDTDAPPAAAAAPVRRDVARNRRLLLNAARELYAAGGDVPMYEVARRAGVGQATLYRHFPDRTALASALSAELLAGLEEFAAGLSGPRTFERLLGELVEVAVTSGALADVIRDGTDPSADFAVLQERMLALFAAPLRRAQRAGEIRSDLTVGDIVLLLRMIHGALDNTGHDPAARAAAAHRALDILLAGLRIRPRARLR